MQSANILEESHNELSYFKQQPLLENEVSIKHKPLKIIEVRKHKDDTNNMVKTYLVQWVQISNGITNVFESECDSEYLRKYFP
jgi:intein-encoded DNA endonuclease-like protein